MRPIVCLALACFLLTAGAGQAGADTNDFTLSRFRTCPPGATNCDAGIQRGAWGTGECE